MKTKLSIMAALCAIAFTANAQTKGTNTLGFGVNFNSNKSASPQTENEQKNNAYSLGYGHFIKENAKITVELSYGESKFTNGNSVQNQKDYGGLIGYQKYFPLVKTFYVFAGARAGYTYGSGESKSINSSSSSINKFNSYNLRAAGGLAWFVSKSFALETDLLSAGATYMKNTQNGADGSTYNYTNTSKSFNLSNGGLFNNLGFKVYLLF